MQTRQSILVSGIFLMAACVFLGACSSKLGWGVLLWSVEDPPIPSGTVLPVYIRSNINKVWVVGPPTEWAGEADKFEIPLSHLELAGSRSRANKKARDFARYALVYAENMQDGLPIRENPDNNAQRVYRMRLGEFVKILSLEQGKPAISATGEPLPGDWYKVLAEDGSTGYCFSYRLRIFEYTGQPFVASVPAAPETPADPNLDMLMSKAWSPESYFTMYNNSKINLEELSRRWHFDPGAETGIAHISADGIDRSFPYTGIRPEGSRAWHFEGTSLVMQMRSDSIINVQLTESGGGTRNLLFVSLPVSVNDLILQETARRERLFNAIYSRGPAYTSSNYGVLTFMANKTFTWNGFDLLVPRHIPETAAVNGSEGKGSILMDLFLAPDLEDRYNGAFSLRFDNSGAAAVLCCMYSLDNQGFRVEIVPPSNIEDITVTGRDLSPMVLYFYRGTELW